MWCGKQDMDFASRIAQFLLPKPLGLILSTSVVSCLPLSGARASFLSRIYCFSSKKLHHKFLHPTYTSTATCASLPFSSAAFASSNTKMKTYYCPVPPQYVIHAKGHGVSSEYVKGTHLGRERISILLLLRRVTTMSPQSPTPLPTVCTSATSWYAASNCSSAPHTSDFSPQHWTCDKHTGLQSWVPMSQTEAR